MNYCVLNGVKSNTVKGLLIQELPPISKPLIRTEIEQIDGRDGDIVTPLGYSAYDKQMKIGLFGDFNIDDVIAYFDSAGKVTFSNEPDKYYNYRIIQQIDFTRLLRFREATVTFHVQPFKYSTVGDDVTASPNRFQGVPDYDTTKNGVTVNARGGNVGFGGSGEKGYTEFYLPISPVTLAPGTYTLNLTANGTGATACPVRLIGELPSDADSFGGNYITLQENATVSTKATLTAAKTFNYLWFYVTPSVPLNFVLEISVVNDGFTSVDVVNMGNTLARPTIAVNGSGIVNIAINGNDVLTLSLGTNESITIDAAAMNAYQGDLLKNRQVAGDYSNVVLQPGTNTVSWSGDVNSVEITNVSRWI